MDKDKVRALLNKFFEGRDLDKDVEKLYPLFDKKRLQATLDGTQDFNKSDVILLLSVGMVSAGIGQIMAAQVTGVAQEIHKEIGLHHLTNS